MTTSHFRICRIKATAPVSTLRGQRATVSCVYLSELSAPIPSESTLGQAWGGDSGRDPDELPLWLKGPHLNPGSRKPHPASLSSELDTEGNGPTPQGCHYERSPDRQGLACGKGSGRGAPTSQQLTPLHHRGRLAEQGGQAVIDGSSLRDFQRHHGARPGHELCRPGERVTKARRVRQPAPSRGRVISDQQCGPRPHTLLSSDLQTHCQVTAHSAPPLGDGTAPLLSPGV